MRWRVWRRIVLRRKRMIRRSSGKYISNLTSDPSSVLDTAWHSLKHPSHSV